MKNNKPHKFPQIGETKTLNKDIDFRNVSIPFKQELVSESWSNVSGEFKPVLNNVKKIRNASNNIDNKIKVKK